MTRFTSEWKGMPPIEYCLDAYRDSMNSVPQGGAGMTLLMHGRAGGEMQALVLQPDADIRLADAVRVALAHVQATWAILHTDGWQKSVDAEEAEQMRPGDVARAAALGDPSVVEVLTVVAVRPGWVRQMSQVYTWEDGERVWHQPEDNRDVESEVVDVMREFVSTAN